MDAPVPVLLLVRELGQGGTERQLTEIAKHLDRRRFEPHVGCLHSSGMRAEELTRASVPIVRFPLRSFASAELLSASRQMGAYLAQHRIRIVHAFDVPMNVFGVPVARLYRAPVVISSQRAYRDLVTTPYRLLLRISDRLADAIVVNCAAMRDHLIANYQVSPARIELCYNGVDTDSFFQCPRRPHEEIVIGGVYALRPEKGLETLIDAFASVHAPHTNTRLVIVGSGATEADLRRRAADLGIASACRFEPSSANVAGWLGQIDIFVLPSRSEALSNSLMEAMACGCACLASRVGGNPELVTHGETGLLFEPGNTQDLSEKIRSLIVDTQARSRLAAAAAARIRSGFTVAAAAQRMGEIYESLASSPRR
jgi:glycosyltransferase involved in cell wall biosynthesis